MSCTDIRTQLTKQFDEGGEIKMSADIWGHLADCDDCRTYAAQLEQLAMQITAHKSITVPPRGRRQAALQPKPGWSVRVAGAMAFAVLLVIAIWRPNESAVQTFAGDENFVAETRLDDEPAQTIIYQLPDDQNTTIVWVYR